MATVAVAAPAIMARRENEGGVEWVFESFAMVFFYFIILIVNHG